MVVGVCTVIFMSNLTAFQAEKPGTRVHHMKLSRSFLKPNLGAENLVHFLITVFARIKLTAPLFSSKDCNYNKAGACNISQEITDHTPEEMSSNSILDIL